MKKFLRACAKCADSHHPAHAQGFISGLCAPLLHSIVSNDSDIGQQRPWSDCADVQSDLCLRCPRMPPRHIFAWLGSYNLQQLQLAAAIVLRIMVIKRGIQMFCLNFFLNTYKPGHCIFYKSTCALSEVSDQYAQADQSLRCPPEGILDPWLPTECPEKTLVRLHGRTCCSDSIRTVVSFWRKNVHNTG